MRSSCATDLPVAELPAFADSDIPTIARPFRLQWEEAQQAWVLLFPEGMVKLNATAGEILKRCNGASPLADLIAGLARTFEADVAADVKAFLSHATERRWVSWRTPTP